MKITNKFNSNLDPIAEARKHLRFQDFSDKASVKLKIAIEIYNARKKHKWSQTELAKKINSTQKVISNIESGKVDPSSYTLSKIAKKLNIPYKYGDAYLGTHYIDISLIDLKSSSNTHPNQMSSDKIEKTTTFTNLQNNV